MSLFNDYFMMKYDIYENTIPKYSKVKFITIINETCLVENVNNYNREWVMKCDIYPLCHKDKLNVIGDWSYSEYFDEIARKNNLKS